MATDIPASTRKLVYARDGHRCRWCGRTNGALHLHHINYRSAGGDHAPSNLITLCVVHHQLVHTDKGLYPTLLQRLLDNPGLTGIALVRQLSRDQV